ncbi:MAG: DEAD/DEAH box helicase [Verrucomicrobiota bacterium]
MPVAEQQAQLHYTIAPKPGGAVLACRFEFPSGMRPKNGVPYHKDGIQNVLKLDFLDAADRRILMRIYMGLTRDQDYIELSGKEGCAIVRDIIETGRCRWRGSDGFLRWNNAPLRGILCWQLLDATTQRPTIQLDGDFKLAATAPVLAIDVKNEIVAEVDCGFPHSLAGAWIESDALNSSAATSFFNEISKRFPDCTPPAPPTIEKRVLRDVRPKPRLNIRRREFSPKRSNLLPAELYVGELWFEYKGERLRYKSPARAATKVENGEVLEMRRDHRLEDREAKWLGGLGLFDLSSVLPGYELGDARYDFAGPIEEPAVWFRFLAEAKEDLEARGWGFQFDGSRDIAIASVDDEFCDMTAEDEQGWFEFEAGIVVDGQKINLLPLVHDLLRRHQGLTADEIRGLIEPQVFFVPTAAGITHVFSGERFYEIIRRIFELYDRDPFDVTGKLRVTGIRAAEIAEAFGMAETPGLAQGLRRIARVLHDGVSIEPAAADPAGLQATLRDYQRLGLAWLQFLAEHQVGGVLADDMGLGKTLQTIAHLVAEKNAGRLEKPALVIAPTSLMKNWANEIAKFAPHFSVLTLHGPERHRYFRVLDATDVVLTTYGSARRDVERHHEREYSWIILDEAQYIKNPDSQATKVLCSFKSERRLCLTGTPVENHLGELWSLFNFLMPGFLGDQESFYRQFRIPIELEESEAMADILTNRVKPFLLRRKKSEVAKELPSKTEIDHPIQMSERQRDIYESIRVAMHEKVQSEIAERGLARSQIVILDALMKLRQICCDPRLANLDEPGLQRRDSAKLEELMDLVPEMIRDGHRILIFSQFTSMLGMIEQELDTAALKYVTLTGQTRDRGACVDAFQSGKVPLFLISLRAGGVGLNLTEADTVIHYDPWWNPAVENQATDRAYRIGQKRPVFVYKMIAEGTVEEKIVEMQKKKADLAEGILSGTGGAKLRFEASDVTALFT